MKDKDNLTQIGFKYYRKMINNLKHYFYPDTFSAEKCLYWTTFTCIEVQRKIIRQCSEQFDEREQLFTYMGRRWVEYRRQIIENISGKKKSETLIIRRAAAMRAIIYDYLPLAARGWC